MCYIYYLVVMFVNRFVDQFDVVVLVVSECVGIVCVCVWWEYVWWLIESVCVGCGIMCVVVVVW